MELRRRELFTTIRTEGAILPPDLLQRVAGGNSDLGGLKTAHYHLFEGEPLNEAIVRSWNRLVGAWAAFSEARARLPAGDLGTTITRERWLLILFDELGYGRLQPARAVEIDGKSYAASHSWGEQHVPLHLVGCNVPLDRRSQGVAGAAAMSPHGLVQELLNRSEERLWGFVSNGLTLRVLRDNSSLTRQAYVEFDLASMMDGEVYADFVVLWLVCHQSRVEGDKPQECWLERWSQEAVKQGTRALDGLRSGVEAAITALGTGFLTYPANAALRDSLRSGALNNQDYYRELLRLVYRLLFLFVSEDRNLLLTPHAAPDVSRRYETHYSTRRLRRLAERRRGTKHADLYSGLRLVMEKLGEDEGCPELGLPALGSYLWSKAALPHLADAELHNSALLDAIRALSTIDEGGVRRAVDYRNLGAEELGSVYESLLELHPDLHVDSGVFVLKSAAGNERKTTGSYYTPSSLISCLLDSALDPVLDEAAAKGEEAILDLKVCDPACGSGHFLVSAAHRIAKRLASARTGDEEPSPEATRTALRDVVGRCLYGVDVNPMAVELCKVSLWMEALEPGRPLSFLDAHIKCGNSLLGTTVKLIEGGVPDDAFKPVMGDDKTVATSLKKQNRDEREGQLTLEDTSAGLVNDLQAETMALEQAGDASVEELREKERRFAALVASEAYERSKLAADAWCASFVQRQLPDAPRITTGLLRRFESDATPPSVARDEVQRLSLEYGFFHWEVEFSNVFRGEGGGFDVVLGNPPWEQLQLDDREFFAGSAPQIAGAQRMAARKQMIDRLADDDPSLHRAYLAAVRALQGVQHFVHTSGRFPLTSYGRLNLAPLFIELMTHILSPGGRIGCIVPSGIATDSFNRFAFRSFVDSRSLASLFDFENRENIFPGIGHGKFKFCLLTLAGSSQPIESVDLVFFALSVDDLHDEWRHFTLTPEEFALLNPNTRTCPVFRTAHDAELNKRVYRRVPILNHESDGQENPWGFRGLLMYMMNTDSGLFELGSELESDGWQLEGNRFRRGDKTYLPLYEGKMIHQFTHRFGDYSMRAKGSLDTELPEISEEKLNDPSYTPQARYWVPAEDVSGRIAGKWDRDWLIGFRDITGSVTSRTVVATVLPRVGVGNQLPVMLVEAREHAVCLLANLSSFVYDYTARQKVGGSHLNFFIISQLPVLTPQTYDETPPWSGEERLREWVGARVLELTYTAYDLQSFARDVGYSGPPFRWDEERRSCLRAELDAAFFHLYGLAEEDVDYVMETFPIVKRRDEEKHGHYRTKALILDVYRKMADAIATGVPYETILDPAPSDPGVAHPDPASSSSPELTRG